jgi:hypothetical protein
MPCVPVFSGHLDDISSFFKPPDPNLRAALIRICCVLLVFTDGLPRITILTVSQAMYKESMLWVCNKHICLDLQVVLIAVIWMLVVIKAWCCLA